jgi:arsenate reductase-like glutaredoxin family protein
LRSAGLEPEVIDYAKTGLTVAVVLELVQKAGGVSAVLNTRHAKAKAEGWASTPPTSDVFAKAVVADVNLLRRPILIHGRRVIVGFDRAAYSALT